MNSDWKATGADIIRPYIVYINSAIRRYASYDFGASETRPYILNSKLSTLSDDAA